MDVEAQEDGVMAKITQQNGAKAVKVGARIAVLAEAGDDVSSLEIPAEDTTPSKPSSSQEPSAEKDQPAHKDTKSSEPATETETSNKDTSSESSEPSSRRPNQKYPFYPSVAHLLHEHNISPSDASKIPTSGPNGRLLKGDVLAHLGNIKKDYSTSQSARITKLGHLDLSNIQRAPARSPEPTKDQPAPRSASTPAPPPQEPDTQIALPISLTAVLATQRRIQESLGLTLPLSTFIARASEIANQGLPRAQAPPTADELFEAVLGLDKVAAPGIKPKSRTSRGSYVPHVTALAPDVAAPRRRPRASSGGKASDIMDVLIGAARPQMTASSNSGRNIPHTIGVASPSSKNVFSVAASKGEEARARTYLQRVKTVLEAEPGRLVL